MGDLITMTRPTVSPAARPTGGGEAEILFFTGVRYHRVVDDAPAQTITRSRRRLDKAKQLTNILRPDQQV